MGKPVLMNDDLLDLLGKLFLELKLALLLPIPFADFIADFESHLSIASMIVIGGDLHPDSIRECADERAEGMALGLGRLGGQAWKGNYF